MRENCRFEIGYRVLQAIAREVLSVSFVVGSARREDLQHIYELARQFTLLNLPAEKSIIEKKIDRSESSFAGELS